MSQPPQQSGGQLRKISLIILSSWCCPAQRKLGLSVQFLFFAEIAWRSLAEQEGGNIQIQETPIKGSVDKSRKALRFLSTRFVLFEVTLLHFEVTLLQSSCLSCGHVVYSNYFVLLCIHNNQTTSDRFSVLCSFSVLLWSSSMDDFG